MTRFDVIVVGGGVAGLATSLAVRSLGHSVAVIERGDYDGHRIGETLAPEIKIPLTELALWDRFEALRCARVVSRLSAWSARRLDETNSIFNPYGPGWLVGRPAFEKMLAGAAVDRGVTLWRNAQLQSCRRDSDGYWRLTLLHGVVPPTIESRFAVVATGRASSLLRGAGEKRASYDRLVAIVARVPRPAGWPADDHRPLIEAMPDGWCYSACFPDGHVDLAIMTDADTAHAEMCRLNSRPAVLRAFLERAPHTRERLNSHLDLLAPVTVVAANTSMNSHVIGDAKLAVGDAVLAIDPLAGQGSFAALDGGIRAARAIDAYFAGRDDALQRYADDERVRFGRYMSDRAAYYGMERRWPHSVFWRRRRDEHGPARREPAYAIEHHYKAR